MSNERDYSLLRPFDLEKAKAGDKVLWDDAEWDYVVGPHQITTEIIIQQDNREGFFIVKSEGIRMAPLCWVEGKPVYAGDGPFYVNDAGNSNAPFYVDSIESMTGVLFGVQEGRRGGAVACSVRLELLSWEPLKKKKYWLVADKRNIPVASGKAAVCFLYPEEPTLTGDDVLLGVIEA